MKIRGDGRAALLAALGCTIGFGCAEAPSQSIHSDEHGDEIERIDLGDRVTSFGLADGESSATFELGEIGFERSFDRAALTWESTGTSEITIDGEPVIVSWSEYVPETGVTLYAGHADFTKETLAFSPSVTLARAGSTPPRLQALEVAVFERGAVMETGAAPTDSLADSDHELASPTQLSIAPPNIITRAEWGAQPALCNGANQKPRRITWHHTVTTNGETGAAAKARMRQIQASHQVDMGWCDIGFHFVVSADGKIYRGRKTTKQTGNHVPNRNANNIGVALMGKFGSVAPPSAQLSGLMNIMAYLADYWDIAPTSDRIRGHRTWTNSNTTCPGAKAFAKRDAVMSGIRSRLRTPGPRVGDFITTSCTTTSVRKLSEQLIAELNCMVPGAVKKIPADSQINTGTAFPYLQTRPANKLPVVVNARPGANMQVHSALRSLAQQYLLFHWHDRGRCGIKAAASPGTSNHESGLAVDISDNAGWRSKMEANGFDWIGAFDPVHFDFEGGGTVNIRGRSVKAFQRLWNANNPTDKISVDGSWGPATAARLKRSPANGFAIYSTCGNHAATNETTQQQFVLAEDDVEVCGL